MSDFVSYILDTINPHIPVQARSMFGGYGIYHNDLMFAIIVKNTLYLKADNETKHNFENENCSPFSYETKNGKRTIMSYYRLPERLFEDAEECKVWLLRSYQVARNTIKDKRISKKKKTMPGTKKPSKKTNSKKKNLSKKRTNKE